MVKCYQLIVQVRYGDDLPDLLDLDDGLAARLGEAHEVDNSDPMNYGVNLDITTEDVNVAFSLARAYFDENGWSRLLRGVTYRELTPERDDDPFVVVWPEGSQEPFPYKYEN